MLGRRIGAVATVAAMLACDGTSVGLAIAHGERLGLFAPDLGASVWFAAIGSFLLWRRAVPRIPVIMCVQGVGSSLTVLTLVIRRLGERSGPLHGVTLWSGWVNSIVWIPAVVLLTPLVLLFPDGRLSSSRWRWLIAAVAVLGLSLEANFVFVRVPVVEGEPYDFAPNPTALVDTSRFFDSVSDVAFIGMIVCLAVSVGSLLVRRHRASGVHRAQLTSLTFGVAVSVVLLAALNPIPGQTNSLVFALELVTIAPIPVSILVGVLRYHLFDLDRLVSRTVSYALVLAVLVGVYVGIVAGLASFVPDRYGNVGVAVATLTAAALAVPLTRRVRRVVDRRFNRARFDAERVAAAFAAHLRSRPDRGDVPADLLEVVQHTVAPTQAAVWLVTPTA